VTCEELVKSYFYDEYYSLPITRERLQWEDLIIEKLVSKFNLRGVILDIGCGLGLDVDTFKTLGLEPIGIDLSYVGLEKARNHSPESEFILCDARRPPFRPQTFDALFSKDLSTLNTKDNASCKSFIETSLVFLKQGHRFIIIYSSNLTGESGSKATWVNHRIADVQSWCEGSRSGLFFVFMDFIQEKIQIFSRFVTLISVFLTKLTKRRGVIFFILIR